MNAFNCGCRGEIENFPIANSLQKVLRKSMFSPGDDLIFPPSCITYPHLANLMQNISRLCLCHFSSHFRPLKKTFCALHVSQSLCIGTFRPRLCNPCREKELSKSVQSTEEYLTQTRIRQNQKSFNFNLKASHSLKFS